MVQFKDKEVKHFVQISSSEGARLDPEYIEAILKLEYLKLKKSI